MQEQVEEPIITAAAKKIREVVEGRIPDAVDEKHVIDYSAGQSFKEQLLRKLAPRDDRGHAEQEPGVAK
jgi:hypothetical protein